MDCTQFARRLWMRCVSRIAVYRRALTRTFDLQTDFFFGLDLLMAAGGVRLNSASTPLRRCWNVYRWAICLPALAVYWNTVLNAVRGEQLEIVLSSLQASVANVVTMVRVVLLLWYYDSLAKVRHFVNRRHYGRDLQASAEARSGAFYHVRKLVTRVIGLMLVFGASIHAIDTSNHHFLKMPFDVKYPKVEVICSEFTKLAIIGWAITVSLVFLVLYMILKGLTTEFEVIAQTFSTVLDNTEQRVQRKLESETDNYRRSSYKKKYYFWKYIQEEFGECIKLNIEILTMKNKIRPLLNANFLLIYYSTAVILANGAIYLSQMKTATLFSLQTLSYCVWICFDCALLTRMVNLLTEANESIGWQVYDLDWPWKLRCDKRFAKQYRSVRETMATVIAVSQQPLRLNCYGLFEFTQERFWELLNMAYSLYTFIRDFL
uniref:Odorant receptor n=1 Tax=Culex quinquefasciatus TaxID=7176 RepID=A0A1S4KI98_CULQU